MASVTLAGKFSQEEVDRIEFETARREITKSALIHELVMKGLDGEDNPKYIAGSEEVTFVFKKDFAYFWKGREYKGVLNGDNASIWFGGGLIPYKLKDLPVEIKR